MGQVKQHLWFEKDMMAALRLYIALVPGSAITATYTLPSEGPAGPAESVGVAEFTLGGQDYIAIQAGPLDPFNHAFSIMVTCEDQAEIDRLWDALREGGSVEQCGWLRDRWGLSWQIVPKQLGPLLADPDRAKAKRAGDAMMEMVKLDVAALERAAAG